MIEPYNDLKDSLKRLKKCWPGPLSKEGSLLFSKAQSALENLKKMTRGKAALSRKRNHFSFVPVLNQTLKSLDMTFLSRQMTYHVVTASDLPKAFGSAEEAQVILEQLLKSSIRQVGFASQLEIRLEGVQLQGGPALEVELVYSGRTADDQERRRILHNVFSDGTPQKEKRGFVYVKMLLRRVGGRIWMAFSKTGEITFAFNWPAYNAGREKTGTGRVTCRCDITLTDYSKIRQRFGVIRAQKLVSHIEDFIRSLVRCPVDMVVGFPVEGALTLIYESQGGESSSVATRISRRLQKEGFRLGKRNVMPKFRYDISYLV